MTNTKVLNTKCRACNGCSLVTHGFNGRPLKEDEMYYQCLGGVEDECLDGESMMVEGLKA